MSERKDTFAERLMKKQGWTEGQGLGKSQQGISAPIKASMKFNSAGVGYDIAKEFTNNWWDLAFKKAANRIQVDENNGDEVAVKSKSRKKAKVMAKNPLYAQFTKSGTLENGKLIEDEKQLDESAKGEINDEQLKNCTNDEIFQDVKSSKTKYGLAKNARIQLMDQIMLDEMNEPKKKRKKRHKEETTSIPS